MPNTQVTLKALLVNRPASEPVDQGLYVKLTASEAEILDLLAEQAGQARNVFIRQMIVTRAKETTMFYTYEITYIDDDGETKVATVEARHEFEAHQVAGTFNKHVVSVVNLDL